MSAEPFSYRARKWVVQQISKVAARSDQHERLNAIDWDVLVVLDACRYDTLRSAADWPIGAARSPGSTTGQWLGAAEKTGIFTDTHIVSGNGQYADYDVGHRGITPVWKTDWNDRYGIVLPEPVFERTDELLNEGERRVVAHILPPHAPYVAKLGDNWFPIFPNIDIWKENRQREDAGRARLSQQEAMALGHVDLERAVEGYRASVRSVWDVTKSFVGRWVADGYRVVVTADHGEMFGRARDYWLVEHPYGCHVTPLVKVPFSVFERGTIPDVTPETVEEKLEALGYA